MSKRELEAGQMLMIPGPSGRVYACQVVEHLVQVNTLNLLVLGPAGAGDKGGGLPGEAHYPPWTVSVQDKLPRRHRLADIQPVRLERSEFRVRRRAAEVHVLAASSRGMPRDDSRLLELNDSERALYGPRFLFLLADVLDFLESDWHPASWSGSSELLERYSFAQRMSPTVRAASVAKPQRQGIALMLVYRQEYLSASGVYTPNSIKRLQVSVSNRLRRLSRHTHALNIEAWWPGHAASSVLVELRSLDDLAVLEGARDEWLVDPLVDCVVSACHLFPQPRRLLGFPSPTQGDWIDRITLRSALFDTPPTVEYRPEWLRG